MTDPLQREARTASQSQVSTPSTHMLPPIITATEGLSKSNQISRQSASSTQQQPFPRSWEDSCSQERPAKRPRLQYDPSHPPGPRLLPALSNFPGHSPSLNRDFHDYRDSPSRVHRTLSDSQVWKKPENVCRACDGSKILVDKVLAGAQKLEEDLKKTLTGTPISRSVASGLTARSAVEALGLHESLALAVNHVNRSSSLLRALPANSRSLSQAPIFSNPGFSTARTAHPESPRSSISLYEGEHSNDGSTRRSIDKVQLPPSPRPSVSAASLYGSSQSPMGTIGSIGSAFMLPSPKSLQTPSTVPSSHGGFSPSPIQPGQASLVQELERQIGNKSLALTNLQREHDQLLLAYSRLQSRCEALDKKSLISDNEVEALTEDKSQLQSQVEAFESQVEELITARDEAQKQMAASGAQYMRILNMSSRLQAQGVEDARRYKQDRDLWERDRTSLEDRLRELEKAPSQYHHNPLTAAVKESLQQEHESTAGGSHHDSQATIFAERLQSEQSVPLADLEQLKAGVTRLRESLLNMEPTLTNVRHEADHVSHVIDRLNAGGEKSPSSFAVPAGCQPAATSVASAVPARASSDSGLGERQPEQERGIGGSVGLEEGSPSNHQGENIARPGSERAIGHGTSHADEENSDVPPPPPPPPQTPSPPSQKPLR